MWRVIGASAIGTSHVDTNLGCQDSYSFDVICVDDQEYLVCLISDGAGSAKEGGKGAELACTTGKSSIEATFLDPNSTLFDESNVENWVLNIRRVIREIADTNSLTPRDYACTFLGVIISSSKAIFFQIGDGAIVASNGHAQGVVFWPDSGPYANMTNFITDEDALTNLHVLVTCRHIDEVAIFSDGIQRLALSFQQLIPHLPFFEPMFNVLRSYDPSQCHVLDEQLANFLNSPQVNERTDDDKTLVLASRRAI